MPPPLQVIGQVFRTKYILNTTRSPDGFAQKLCGAIRTLTYLLPLPSRSAVQRFVTAILFAGGRRRERWCRSRPVDCYERPALRRWCGCCGRTSGAEETAAWWQPQTAADCMTFARARRCGLGG